MKNGDTQSRQRQPPGSLASETIRNKRPPGADISFSISRAPIGNPPSSPRLFFGPFGQPARLRALSALFFSVIFPAAHLSLLNETGEADGTGASPLLRPFFSSVPFFLPFSFFFFFFVTGRRMQKRERALREPGWRQALQRHLQGP